MTLHVKPPTPRLDKRLLLATLATLPGCDAIPLGKAGTPRAKRPADFGWQKKAYNSAKVIDRCIREGRNVGFRLSPRVFVVDNDPRNWETSGLDPYLALASELGIDTEAGPKWKTGGGGYHQPYIIPEAQVGEFSKSLEGDEYKGLEFRNGQGQMIVAPGSLHPSGKLYEVERDGSPVKAPRRLLTHTRRPPRGEGVGGGTYTVEELERALDSIDPAHFDSHDPWLNLMMACHHATGGDGRDAFVAWSTSDSKFANHGHMIGRRWDTLDADRNDGVTFKTLNKALRDHGNAALVPTAATGAGDDFPDDAPASAAEEFDAWAEEDAGDDPTYPVAVMARGLKVNKDSIASDTFKNALGAIYTAGLRPAFNEMAKQVEFSGDVPWDVGKFGRVLDDAVLAAVRVHMIGRFQGNDYDPSLKNLNEALDAIAYGNRFNPVRDYLDALEWDGTPRVGTLFGKYLKCGVDSYTRGVSIAFAVGAVARIRHPGCKFDTMPVLKGPQGWNKSTALRVLFGDAYFSDTSLGPLTNKDASMKLRGKWCHEFSEIESLRKHEINVLKAFISSQVDRQRDPYERRVADVPRCTVFAGTVNEGGYLSDATGGRRFWPLELRERIDLEALQADRDQLWAEAATLEADGMSRVLPVKLWGVAGERQEAETLTDPWEDVLRAYLARRAAGADWDGTEDDEDSFGAEPPPPDKVHASDLFNALGILAKDQNRATGGRLRTVMEAGLGWKHRKAVRIGDENRAGYVR